MTLSPARRWIRLSACVALTALVLATSISQAQSVKDKAARYYEDALQRYERKDIAGAIIQLKNALQIDKSQLPVQMLMGKALLANSDPIGAEVAFNEALRLGVSRQEVVMPLAQALVDQGKLNQMLESPQFDTAGLPPQIQQQLLLLKAQSWADTGQAARAMRAVDDARALSPDAPEVWLAEAALRLRARQYPEALNAIERAARLGPPSAELHFQRASVLHLQGRLPDAIEAYGRALQLKPGHVEAAVSRIGILLDQGRDKDAAADLTALLNLQQKDPRGLYLKAVLAERAGDRAAAKNALAQITALMDPVPIEFIRYRPQFLLLTALAHFGQGSLGKAKPYLEAAHRTQGPSPVAKLLAQVYLEEKTPDKAIEVLESYLRAAPGDGNALTLLASIHTAQGRHVKATNMMRDALTAQDKPEFRTMLGLSLLSGGQTGDALQSLEQALKRDPKQIYAAAALVSVYLREGRNASAVTVANGIAKHYPNNPSVLVLQGTAAARTGDAKAARRAFEAAAKLSPGLLQAELGLARLDIDDRAFASAEKRLLALHKADERNVDVLIELIGLAEAENKPAELERWLSRADDVAGLNDIRPGLAQVHARLKTRQAAKALEASRKLITKAPEDPAVLTLHAQVQLLNGDVAGARSSLAAAARRSGAVVPTLLKIAELQMQARDLAGAEYSLEKVLSVDAKSLRAHALMSGIETQQGNLAAAERRARELVQSHPKSAQGHHLLADIALARRQPAAAIGPLRRAHQLEPTSLSLLRLFSVQQAVDGHKAAVQVAEAWLRQYPRDTLVLKAVGDSHARLKAFELAAQAYDRALKADPNDAEALNSLASVRLAQGQMSAITLAQRAVQLEPGNALYIDTLGWAEFRLGQAERALPLLRDARLRLPGNAEIRLHLGEVLMKLGRLAEARAELEAASRHPQDKESAQRAGVLLQTLK